MAPKRRDPTTCVMRTCCRRRQIQAQDLDAWGMYVCVYKHTHAHTHTHTHMNARTCERTQAADLQVSSPDTLCMYVCMHTNMYVCMFAHTHTHTTHTHTHNTHTQHTQHTHNTDTQHTHTTHTHTRQRTQAPYLRPTRPM